MFSSEGDWICDLFSSTVARFFRNVDCGQWILKSDLRLRHSLLCLVRGTTSACALKLFRNIVALEKDEEQVSFISMRIRVLWECLDQDEKVGAKHIADTERFQTASREPIPPLVGEPGELIELDDELVEDPTVAKLIGEDNQANDLDESPGKDDEQNNEDTVIAM